jgi:mono/diheme cytochrome c family protein
MPEIQLRQPRRLNDTSRSGYGEMMVGRHSPTGRTGRFGLTVVACVGLLAAALVLRHDGAALLQADPIVTVSAFTQEYHTTVLPLLTKYCYDCHGDGAGAGDLELDAYESAEDLAAAHETWEKVIRYVRTHTMPPPEMDEYPSQLERDQLVDSLQRIVYRIDPANPDPGHVTIRRLNRAEYRNTIRDLIGVSFDPTIEFPEDDTGYGFDNIADVLTLPPMLMEKYLAAAEKILDEAIPTDIEASRERRMTASQAEPSSSSIERRDDGWMVLASRDEDTLSVAIDRAMPADYLVRVLAFAERDAEDQSNEPIKLSFMSGSAIAAELEIAGDPSEPKWYEARVPIAAGKHSIRLSVRRQRGLEHDRVVHEGRVGPAQPGRVLVKELVIVGPIDGAVRRLRELNLDGNGHRSGESFHLYSGNAVVSGHVELSGGEGVQLRITASADFAGDEPARLQLLVDDQPLEVLEIDAPHQYRRADGESLASDAERAVPRVYTIELKLEPGRRKIALKFINDAYHADAPHPHYRDRNVHVHNLEVVELSSPPLPKPMSEPMRRLFTKHAGPAARISNAPIAHDSAAARAIVADFALRAWRRPALHSELDRLMKLYDFARDHDERFHASVKHAMKAVLVSSSFLFRGEPPMAQPAQVAQREHRPVDEFELASRLSYFLWSSTPDDELLELAQRQALRDNLDQQVKRMLASDKAKSLIENFAGQWLQFRNLDAVHPDRKLFEHYDDKLREAMRRETQLFFETIMGEDRNLLDVLIADFTFVNERLAKHYGLPDVKGDEFRRVSLADTPRRGVVTHGSVLTLTSNPTRTSPVKRGKWVLENLLGAEPPPPPPDIPELEEHKEVSGTMRQRLEAHRADPGCASCHAPMDPIGFGLENFDAIGAWRDKDGADPIDATSAFADGTEFTGAAELMALLAQSRRGDYYRSLAQNMLTFALGRGVEPYDQPAIERIVKDLHENDAKFSVLIDAVVRSVPFQMRRAGEELPVVSHGLPAGGSSAGGSAASLASGDEPVATEN